MHADQLHAHPKSMHLVVAPFANTLEFMTVTRQHQKQKHPDPNVGTLAKESFFTDLNYRVLPPDILQITESRALKIILWNCW
jgi:hypothetical protein